MSDENNRYSGINAHLNSFLQQPDGGWEAFHARHISDLATALDERLPGNYYAVEEKSLQSQAYDPVMPSPVRHMRTTPDVTVYRGEQESATVEPSPTFTPTLIFPLVETFSEEESMNSVMIYRVEEGKMPGIPVTRVELLSPANKPHGTYYVQYLSKRQETLKSGLRLVEIDYLHETKPYLPQIPSYPDREKGAFPYAIVVSNPSPTLEDGQTQVFGFGVDMTLPIIHVPLMDADSLLLDFGAVYQHTLASRRVFRMVVNYDELPVNFERYTEADQAKIRQLLATHQ